MTGIASGKLGPAFATIDAIESILVADKSPGDPLCGTLTEAQQHSLLCGYNALRSGRAVTVDEVSGDLLMGITL